ncbi:hypothetical protein CKA38_08170 [Ereboglobus luteus]|uniref:Uncharacterized protein n=1 Tax=Ereboglobus luteus TaxID=1796921 RepID=A0A2U8E2X0_9BACT|nr:hypothetical protein CKA38_08170 [Ereboglobus luteus]
MRFQIEIHRQAFIEEFPRQRGFRGPSNETAGNHPSNFPKFFVISIYVRTAHSHSNCINIPIAQFFPNCCIANSLPKKRNP